MKAAIFGLGEAGSAIASDLADAGTDVRAFDPARVSTPPGVLRVDEPAAAVFEADVVMSITAGSDAAAAMAQTWAGGEPALYADLSTASPGLKEDLSCSAAEHDVPFADVALMATVPGRGIATPSLASGSGADRYALWINALGGSVVPIGSDAGRAAGRKLLRSVVTKGLTGVVRESLEAAAAREDQDWLRTHLVELFSQLDVEFLDRLLQGTERHRSRRIQEMEDAARLLVEVGVEPTMTNATVEHLRRIKLR